MFYFRAAVLAALGIGISGCLTLRDLSTNYIDPSLKINPKEVLSVAYIKAEDESGHPPHRWYGYIGNPMAVLGLGYLWPFPVDMRMIPSPALWESNQSVIEDAFAPELTNILNKGIAESNTTFVPPKKTTPARLRELARRNGKRYLYLVRVNLFRGFSSRQNLAGGAYYWRKYRGYFAVGSRVLIDVQSGKRILVRERIGEKYRWWFPLANGYSNDFSGEFHTWDFIKFRGNTESDAYARKVGSTVRKAAMERFARYIQLKDIAPYSGNGT